MGSVEADRQHRQPVEGHGRTLGRGGGGGRLGQRGIDGGVDALGQTVALEIEAVDRALGPRDGGIVRPRKPGDVLELPLFQVRVEKLQQELHQSVGNGSVGAPWAV